MRRRLQTALLFAISLLLSSCGGGGTVAEGGIGGTGISMGRVTGFGSIFVNGIEYETGTATFQINEASGSESDLAVGMVVRVSGSKDATTASGVAVSVEYDSLVTGPVDALFDPVADTIGVMGQVISVNTDTVYEGSAAKPMLIDLAIDDIVEISGFSDGGSGTVLATRIELKTSVTRFEVTGKVAIITGTTFQIGDLTIEAGGMSIPPVGTLVEAEGDAPLSGGQLIADSVSVVGSGDGTVGDDGEEIEFEGQITIGLGQAPLTSTQLAVNGQIVELLGSTTFENGDTSDLVSDRIIEVEGVMDGSVLLAEKIEIEADESSKVELSGIVTNVIPDGTGAGTIVLLDKSIHVTNSTIMESDLDGESTFNLSELLAGLSDSDPDNDYVEARVFTDTDGNMVATKLEREPLPNPAHAELEGRISNLTASTFTIAGVLVDFSGNSTSYIPSTDDLVEVVGTYSGGILTADTVRLAN